jgi:hypothetical protein
MRYSKTRISDSTAHGYGHRHGDRLLVVAGDLQLGVHVNLGERHLAANASIDRRTLCDGENHFRIAVGGRWESHI